MRELVEALVKAKKYITDHANAAPGDEQGVHWGQAKETMLAIREALIVAEGAHFFKVGRGILPGERECSVELAISVSSDCTPAEKDLLVRLLAEPLKTLTFPGPGSRTWLMEQPCHGRDLIT